ncbi:hypothetical protein DMENIID0001_023160 [Sergentomyia squamirostris]
MPRKKGKVLRQKGEKVSDDGEPDEKGCGKICGFLGALKILLRHSVTTRATSVAIRIDLEYPYLQIADNGEGISRSEIGQIGKPTFLDLITAAEEVSIETMTMSMKESTIMKFRNKVLLEPESMTRTSELRVPVNGETFDWFQSSREAGCSKAILCTGESSCHQRQSIGTTFTLTNIQLSIMEKCEQLKKKIVNHVKTFAILHHHMSISVKDIKGSKLLFGTKKSKSISDKVASIYDLNMTFQSIVMSSDNITVDALFGLKFYNLAEVQFVFINEEPCSNARLLKTIKNEWKCGCGLREYPVYVLRITIKIMASTGFDSLAQDTVIKDCIRKCVSKFKKSQISDEDCLDDDEDGHCNRSIYVRPEVLSEAKKKSKERKDVVSSTKQNNGQNVEILPSPIFRQSITPAIETFKTIPEKERSSGAEIIRPKTPPLIEKNVTNLTLSDAKTKRLYFRTCSSSEILTPSFLHTRSIHPDLVNPSSQNNPHVTELQNQVRHLQTELSLLRSARSHVSESRRRPNYEEWKTITEVLREPCTSNESQRTPNKRIKTTSHVTTENITQKSSKVSPRRQDPLPGEPLSKRLAPLNHEHAPQGGSSAIHIYNYAQLSVFNGPQPQKPEPSNQLL